MWLGTGGRWSEPLWDVGEPSLWKPLSILDTGEPCWDRGSEARRKGWEGCWGKQQELLRAGQLGPRGSHD